MNITIAVNDFQHESWEKAFFPEDLPKDWQFDYYSNEFDAIFLSKSSQQSIGKSQIDEMLSETDDSFVFVLESNEGNASLETESGILFVYFSCEIGPNQNDLGIPELFLQQAKLTNRQNIDESACVLRVDSARVIKNDEIKQVLMHIYTNYGEYEQVYLFFAGSLQNIETINTARIINDLL